MPPSNTHPSYLIIGAGIFGASTAYHLSKTSRFSSITLIDRTPFPCPLAASYDYQKVVRADYGDKFYMSLAIKSQNAWRHDPFFTRFYHESGVVYVEGDDLGQKMLENWKELGIPNKAKVVDAEELVKLYPKFHDADYKTEPDCFVNPESGWAEATASLKAVIQAAVDNGAKYVEGSLSKVSFNLDGDCTGVQLEDGRTIEASKIVLATGAVTPKIIADSAPDRPELQVEERLLAAGVVTGTVKLSPKQMEEFKDMPVFIHRAGPTQGETYPPTKDRILKFCRDISFANTYKHAGTGQEISAPPYDKAHHEDQSYAPKVLQDEIKLVMKGIFGKEQEGMEIDHYRVCWDAFTPNQDFIISPHPRCPSLYIATGGSFHGWKFFPIIGEYVVECLEGTLNKDMAERWGWDRAQDGAAQGMLRPGREWRDLVDG